MTDTTLTFDFSLIYSSVIDTVTWRLLIRVPDGILVCKMTFDNRVNFTRSSSLHIRCLLLIVIVEFRNILGKQSDKMLQKQYYKNKNKIVKQTLVPVNMNIFLQMLLRFCWTEIPFLCDFVYFDFVFCFEYFGKGNNIAKKWGLLIFKYIWLTVITQIDIFFHILDPLCYHLNPFVACNLQRYCATFTHSFTVIYYTHGGTSPIHDVTGDIHRLTVTRT